MKQFDISSLRNPSIKAVLHLQKRRERDRRGLFVIEGTREIERAVRAGIALEEAFICPPLVSGAQDRSALRKIESLGIPLSSVSRRVFGRIAYRENTGGLVAVAAKPRFSLDDLPQGGIPLYLVVEGVEKPGNLGAIFRSADGAGVSGLIATDPGTDLCNPNLIRASLGTVFTVRAAVTDAGTAIRWLGERGIAIAASSPSAETAYTQADLTGACAIVIGSEDTGIGERWLGAADRRISIPMLGAADSLNVSAAAAVLLYEALRQRSRAPRGARRGNKDR